MGFENDDKRHNDLINVKETELTIHRNWQHWVHKTQDEDNPETLAHELIITFYTFGMFQNRLLKIQFYYIVYIF